MANTSKFAALALAGAVTLGTVASTNAAPVTSGVAGIKQAATDPVENVQFRRYGYGRGFGAAPFVAGAIIGGAALAATAPWYGYGYAPAYYGYGYPAYGYARPYYRPYYRPYAYYGYGPRYGYRGGWGW